jgi:cell division protease FtsH
MYLYTCEYLKSRIAVALAGVLAEELIFGNKSTGGTSDFKHAADMAKQIIYSGMSELGIISVEDLPRDQLHSAITVILREVENDTRSLLSKHERIIKQVLELLLDKETISGDELRLLLNNSNSSECA